MGGASLLVTMLAAIAEFQRELIRERSGEGRRRAMAAGVKFGGPALSASSCRAPPQRL
jgi:DNA invertase Pin-like site-specific DNA recombinase